MALSLPHPAAIREHILSVMRSSKIPVQKPSMASLRTPEAVKVSEINPLKNLAKKVDAIPKMPKNPAGTKWAG